MPDQSDRSDAVVALAFRIGFVLAILFLALQIVRPFLGILLWAAVLAVTLYPFYDRLVGRAGGFRTPIALALALVGLAVVFGPISLLAIELAENLQTLLGRIAGDEPVVPAPPEAVAGWPVAGPYLYGLWGQAHTNLDGLLREFEPHLAAFGSAALAAAAATGWEILQFALAVLLAGYMLRRSETIGTGTERLAAWVDAARGSDMLLTVTETIRQVSRGVIGIALLQALLAGLGLMAAGVPAAGLIAFGVLALAISQIGPHFLLLPVAAWSFTLFDAVWAVAFTAYIVPVSFLDNVLKPIVFSRGLATPMWVILVGVFGGTLSFGLIGIFLGPVVLAVAYDILRLGFAAGPTDRE